MIKKHVFNKLLIKVNSGIAEDSSDDNICKDKEESDANAPPQQSSAVINME